LAYSNVQGHGTGEAAPLFVEGSLQDMQRKVHTRTD
jgi:hypothetical protein